MVQPIHADQVGFIPSRNTAQNVRRLLDILDADTYGKPSSAVLAIDIEKAFDSLEWAYLFQVMRRFGLGDDFVD